MTADDNSGADRGQLREEAAAWFARMRGPDAERHAPEFERWLARGALHRAAYNRIGEIFSQGKMLKREADVRWQKRALVGLVAIIIALSGLLAISLAKGEPRNGASSVIAQRLSTARGEVEHAALFDGSAVILDGNSILAARFDRDARILRIGRGRVRFHVRRDARPFVVAAADARVIAHGTIFDVSVLHNEVAVTLIEGSIEVISATGDPSVPAQRMVLRKTGEVLIDDQRIVRRSGVATPSDWTRTLLTVDRAALETVVARANRVNATKIMVSDPAVARLLVSGNFSIANADALAERLATLLDLEIDRRTPGVIVLLGRPR